MSDAPTGLPAAVLWDMDGTLLDSEKLWDIAMAEFALRLGTTMTTELRDSTLGNSMPNAIAKVFAAAGITPSARDNATSADWLRTRVVQLFDDGIPWMPGARDALNLVAAQNIPMVLVTNTERDLTEHALGTIGKERFVATICGDEVELGKPDPAIYRRAAELAGVAPHRALAIEDSPTGTRAAVAAGVPVLVVASQIPVPDGPGQVHRDDLVGLSVEDLRVLHVRAGMSTCENQTS